MWIRGDLADIRAKVRAAKLPVTFFSSAADFNVHSVYEPLTFTFEYLTALSLLCGVVAVVGLLLYLEARTPGHRRSYVMLRRMGMRTPSHWRAMLWELGPPLLVGLALGLASAVVSAWTLRHNFDVEPGQPPGTLLTLPTSAMVGLAVAVGVVTVMASAYGQVRVARVNPSTVLRDVL
jgi:putative ABC transport system permease protein